MPDKIPKNNLPPQIQELLKQKGWTWTPEENLKVQIREAMNRFSGSSHTPIAILKEMHQNFSGRFP